jgi:hypothetical protein
LGIIHDFIRYRRSFIILLIILIVIVFSPILWVTHNPYLSTACALAITYFNLEILYFDFDNYFKKNYRPPNENQYILEYTLQHEYKCFENIKNEFNQLQTVIGLIFTGIILFFAIGDVNNVLINQGFLIGLLGVSFCLLNFMIIKMESIPPIETQSRSEIYRKMREINQKNSNRIVFARLFLAVAILFAILMTLTIYDGMIIWYPDKSNQISNLSNNSTPINIEYNNYTFIQSNISLSGVFTIIPNENGTNTNFSGLQYSYVKNL